MCELNSIVDFCRCYVYIIRRWWAINENELRFEWRTKKFTRSKRKIEEEQFDVAYITFDFRD